MTDAQNSAPVRTIGRPFPKGVSGNPGGRPKAIRELREKLAPHGEEMVTALLDTIRSGTGAVRLEAVKVGFAYLYGKPDSFDPMTLTDEELLMIVRARTAEERAERNDSHKEKRDERRTDTRASAIADG